MNRTNNRTFLMHSRVSNNLDSLASSQKEDARHRSPGSWRHTPRQHSSYSREWHDTNDTSTFEKNPNFSSYVISNNIERECNRSMSGEALLNTPAPKRASLLPTPTSSLLPTPQTPPSASNLAPNLLSYPPNPSFSYPPQNSYTITNFDQHQKLATGSIHPSRSDKKLPGEPLHRTRSRSGEQHLIPHQLNSTTNYPTQPQIQLSRLPTPKVKYLPGYGPDTLVVERPLQQPKKHNNPLKLNEQSETNYIDEIQTRISTNLFEGIISKTRDPRVLVNCIKALTEIRQILPQPGHGMISVKDKKSIFMALNDTLQFLHNSYSEQNQYRHLNVLDPGSSQAFPEVATYRTKQEFVNVTAISILKFLENGEDISKLDEIDLNYNSDLEKIPEHSQWIYKLNEDLTEDRVNLESNVQQPEELDGLIEPNINLVFDDSEFLDS